MTGREHTVKNVTRKLASIRKIDDITPIENADAIECATVGGWRVVVRKGEFRAGDLAVYLEIDAWVPHELAPFLSSGTPHEYNGVRGERLRTVKLRGQISQGLLLPVPPDLRDRPAGEDVTEVLGVRKWEASIPTNLGEQMRGAFPSCVPKTDQERVQNLSRDEVFAQGPYEVSEKLDGSSCTMMLLDDEFHVCSRNLDLLRDENNAFWHVAIRDDIERKLRKARLNNFALQGELIGPGVQGNYYELPHLCFCIFDIFDIKTGRYLEFWLRRALTEKLGLTHVPVLRVELRAVCDIDSALDMAQGVSAFVAKEREGLVFKNTANVRFSFKAINNRHLLETGS
jgi:RNA ligase (TIGR02306 family)